MVDALRLSTLQQLLLTLNLMTVRLYLQSGYWQVAQVVSYAFLNHNYQRHLRSIFEFAITSQIEANHATCH
jgi:hypothetical protein